MNLSKISLICAIIVAVLTGTSVFISIITRLKANGKKAKQARSDAENLKEIANDQAEKANAQAREIKSLESLNAIVRSIIPNAIMVAEQAGIANGPAKLSFALAQVALWCTENDFSFVENKKLIEDEIEKLIGFSKVVNPRKDETHHG